MGLTRLLRKANIARLATPLVAMWKLLRHPSTPTPAKAAALATLIYTVSPVDVVPDVLPLLGILDDVTLISAGVALAMRLTPQTLWQARIAEARSTVNRMGPRVVWGAVAVFALWSLLLLALVWWLASALIFG